jgi:hypothetical protein
MERQVPVFIINSKSLERDWQAKPAAFTYSPQARPIPRAIRLADVPSLFAEGAEADRPARSAAFWRQGVAGLRRLMAFRRGAARQ